MLIYQQLLTITMDKTDATIREELTIILITIVIITPFSRNITTSNNNYKDYNW